MPDADAPQPVSHIRFIVGCVTVLAALSCIGGAWLLWKGFAGGELLCSQVGTAIGGLLGMLSQRQPQQPTVSVSGQSTTTTATPQNTTVTTGTP